MVKIAQYRLRRTSAGKGEMMAEQLRLTFQDYDGTGQTTSIRVIELDAPANYATWETPVGALATAIATLSAGRDARQEYIIGIVDNGQGSATSPVAQGSTQAILEIEEISTGNIYKERVPMPDLTMADDVGTNDAWVKVGQGQNSLTILNPAHAFFTTLKDAYDAVGVSPNGLSATLNRVYIEN